ncbi:MAG: aminotransferase class IV [Cryomorphaceae bacterium]|nr:aminotransferase class IV [Cryomorphaceae bacterium]
MSTFFFDGKWTDESHIQINTSDRALQYGDGVFETLRYSNKQFHWAEDHYFRLMANMRIMRMNIPDDLTPEYFHDILQELVSVNHWENDSVRIRVQAWRKPGGNYTPSNNDIHILARAERIPESRYELNEGDLKTDIYKDFYKPQHLLSSVKSCNAQLYILASVYRKENHLDECFLLNENKQIVEAISSNIMLVKDQVLTTPPTSSGALKGIMRKRIVEKLAPALGYEVKETNISPFDLNKADEIWLTNSIQGIRAVSHFRKKEFTNSKAKQMVDMLNAQFD